MLVEVGGLIEGRLPFISRKAALGREGHTILNTISFSIVGNLHDVNFGLPVIHTAADSRCGVLMLICGSPEQTPRVPSDKEL